MSRNTILLRVQGDLEHPEELISAVGMPAETTSRGSRDRVEKLPKADVILFRLASWTGVSVEDQDKAEREQLLPIAARLQQAAPVLAALDRSRCTAELYVSSIRREEQGGLEFPAELIAAAAAGGLRLGISILVLLDDGPEEVSNTRSMTSSTPST